MFRAINRVSQTRTRRRCDRFAWLVALLFCTSFSVTPKAAAAVKVLELQPSSPHPRIGVHFEGKPFANAKIEIFRDYESAEEPSFTVVTDESGSAKIPELSPGRYRVFVSAKPKLMGNLYLRVSSSVSNNNSQFTIDLECCAPPTFEEIVDSAEEHEMQDHLQSLEGIIKDQSGAPIPNALVDVVVRGTRGRVHAARLRSDLNGRFSEPMKDGEYVVLFSAPGFSVRVVPISISQENGSGQMHVTLNVGPSN